MQTLYKAYNTTDHFYSTAYSFSKLGEHTLSRDGQRSSRRLFHRSNASQPRCHGTAWPLLPAVALLSTRLRNSIQPRVLETTKPPRQPSRLTRQAGRLTSGQHAGMTLCAQHVPTALSQRSLLEFIFFFSPGEGTEAEAAADSPLPTLHELQRRICLL
ncbi:uncharacterized protein MCYG_07073 [Microsporum canis CBS 113480]|uniref:Uncharacterized protein n=1 Tax=Arthroderma otae (strain ATCC MYA-4605 / CBS 113480) TaxID=554155 RepID=C5FWH0_ARTOC|nr:uncharacterized protein MCYG_07073 [Microsporum canis CBS 113480]EEQ34254.1 predicted protein [Microsporum canis CBS 113480]